ncbi:family 1 glycosylhydrolase [Mycobacterium sp. NPDC003323]
MNRRRVSAPLAAEIPVGRVGGLAFALGVGVVTAGLALATPAHADTGESTGAASSSESADARDTEARDTTTPESADSDQKADDDKAETDDDDDAPVKGRSVRTADDDEPAPDRDRDHTRAVDDDASESLKPRTGPRRSTAPQHHVASTELRTEAAEPERSEPQIDELTADVPTSQQPDADAPAGVVVSSPERETEVRTVMTARTESSGALPDPEPATPSLWTFLAGIGRHLQRTFDNRYPTLSPTILDRTPEGVVTGSLNGFDFDGDDLRFTVVGRPSLGRVEIDQESGTFTYTPVVDFASYGGNDAFTISVIDKAPFALHGLRGLMNLPFDLIRGIPFVGSLLSDYLPTTTVRSTVKLTFDGTGEVSALAFPPGFHWGVAGAGFQHEMGTGTPLDVNSDWWQWTHDPFNRLLFGWKPDARPENGPGQYTQYPGDIALARDGVGADTYRMGIEWSRIFSSSTAGVDTSGGFTPEVLAQLDALANADEVQHYRDVLTAVRAAGLDPVVAINHFTLPLWVHNPAEFRGPAIIGRTPTEAAGWTSSATAEEFEKYSAYLAYKYGDLVDNWITLNEPVNSMLTSYFGIPFGTGFPPSLLRPDLVARGLRNEAAAHAAAYDVIHQLDSTANVGIALNMVAWRGANPESLSDQRAAADFSQFYNRWFPDAVISGRIDANFNGVIEDDEIHPELAGKADFFGVQYYSQGSVIGFGGNRANSSMPIIKGYPQFAPLLNVAFNTGCPSVQCSDMRQVIDPAGFREVLDIAASYGVPIWVSENGVADADDSDRASYLVRHLAVLNKAIADGLDIRGYTAWSLVDNLEWILGYQPKFGLYSYDPVTLERTPRPSVGTYNDIFTNSAISAELFRQYVKDRRV